VFAGAAPGAETEAEIDAGCAIGGDGGGLTVGCTVTGRGGGGVDETAGFRISTAGSPVMMSGAGAWGGIAGGEVGGVRRTGAAPVLARVSFASCEAFRAGDSRSARRLSQEKNR
jgi:hypothetical protein